MKKIKPPYWLILFLIILYFIKDSLESDIQFLQMPWEDKVPFLEQGSPLMTVDNENLLAGTCFDFYPRFGVLEQNIGNEGGIYLVLENGDRIYKALFHIYGKIHPGSANYEIRICNSTTFVVNRCEKSGSCQVLTECLEAVISNTRNLILSDKAVYISWRKKVHTLDILVQRKNKLYTCKDHNPFEVHKLVMENSERQVVSKKRFSFNKITSGNGWSRKLIPNLNASRSVYLQCLQCLHCTTTAFLECGNLPPEKVTIQGSKGSPVTFRNSMKFTGWDEIILTPKIVNDYANCKLKVELGYSQNVHEKIFEKFWYFTEDDIPECPDSRNSSLNCSELTETVYGNNKTLNKCTLKVDDMDQCSYERMDVFFSQKFSISDYPKSLPCLNTSPHLECKTFDESLGKNNNKMFRDCSLTVEDNESYMCPFEKINVNIQKNPCPQFDLNVEFLKCSRTDYKQDSDERLLEDCTLVLDQQKRNCTYRFKHLRLNVSRLCNTTACENSTTIPPVTFVAPVTSTAPVTCQPPPPPVCPTCSIPIVNSVLIIINIIITSLLFGCFLHKTRLQRNLTNPNIDLQDLVSGNE